MAKIFVSTNKSDVNNVIELNKKAGFKNFTTFESEHFSLVVFKKKIHPIDNFYQDNNGNFAALVGTGFYNGVNGVEALKGILADFHSNVARIQEQTIGNYLLAIYKEGSLYFVTDTYQVIKSYYTEYDNGWAVSNDFSSLMSTKGQLTDDSVDYFGLLSETFLVSSFSKNTLIKNINRLFGFEYLCTNNDELSIQHMGHRKNIYDLSKLTRQKIAEDYTTLINKYIEIIKNNFGESVGLHQTGGLDNRTLLAAFLNRDIKPQMLYGVGNSCLTNTRREDLDIVRMFEKDLGLKLKLMDWSNDKEMIKSQNWDDLFKKYGFLYSVYGGSESFFNSYEQSYDNYPKFMECGYFLENLRLREFARDNIDESITLNDFIEQYLLRGVDDSIVNHFDAYKNYLTEELKLQIDIYGIDLSKGITKENFDEVRWIHARHADTIMVNFLNLYTSSFSIFSQPELHQYPFNVPSRFRENGSFQLMVIKALYPKLLDFPFFSHLKPHYFDPIKVVLKPIVTTSKPQQYRLKTKAYIEKALGTNITNYLLMMYRKFRKTKNTQVPDSFEKIISHTTTSIISNSQLKKDLRVNTKTGDLRLPMRIALTLKAIDYSRVRKN